MDGRAARRRRLEPSAQALGCGRLCVTRRSGHAGACRLPGNPNVLLVVLDTVRAKSVLLYGARRLTTPLLTEFARRGKVFERAYVTAPWTLPSHGSMFTGRDEREIASGYKIAASAGVSNARRDPAAPGGTWTAGFVANRILAIPAIRSRPRLRSLRRR